VEALIEPLAVVIVSEHAAIGELFEARRLLEPAIAGLAALRATPEEIADMERILDEQAKEVAAGKTGIDEDAAFHEALAGAAHNRAITRIIHVLVDLLTRTREESLHTPGRPTRSHEDHRRVLAAIQRRDGEAASAAMRDHLVAVERLVIARPGP
jgi:GntR family transcriptional repressor for pyruvate dehydrogenase complex